MDTSNGRSCISYKILKRLKLMLQSLQLVDTCRFSHPEGRDFTHFSVPHARYSRLDYLFVSQRDITKVTGAHIGIQTFSDHSPVSLSVDLVNPSRCSPTWRLNASLLTDPTTLPSLTDCLTEFFKLNAVPGADPLSVWEAHKCSVRGVLINMGAWRKRERKALTLKLTTQINSLETLHKQSLSIESATQLLEARREFQQLLDSSAKRMLLFKERLY